MEKKKEKKYEIFNFFKGKITWPSASSLEEILQIISIKKKKVTRR